MDLFIPRSGVATSFRADYIFKTYLLNLIDEKIIVRGATRRLCN
jgi:hypothetical protein